MSDPVIAWEWDGKSADATLYVDGRQAWGDPAEIEAMFRAMSEMQGRLVRAELHIANIVSGVRDLSRLAGSEP